MNTPPSRLSCSSFGVAAERLLLPIDLERCPFEIFQLANGLAKPFGGEVILLHVLDPRAAAGGTAGDMARRHLENISRDFMRSSVEARHRVRTGIPHEEIFAEAAATGADMILLPVHPPSIWKKIVGSGYGSTARKVVAGAPCRVYVVTVRTRFNCMRRWGAENSPNRCPA